MREIVVIAPIKDLYDKANALVAKHGYDNVEVLFGSMSEGVRVAREAIRKGAQFIVTRGGTYQMIHENFPNISIVEIKVNAYDIINSFGKITDHNQPIGVVGYSNVVFGMDILRNVLNYNVIEVQLHQESDVRKVIERHKKMGINTYIGDANILPIIKEVGCQGILITSQENSILAAIQEARSICSATKDEKKRAQQIATIIDYVHDAIIAVDENSLLTVINKKAEEIFGISCKEAINRPIVGLIPNTKLPEVLKTGQPQIGEIQNIGSQKIATNRVPILVDGEAKGAVATFQAIAEMQSIEQKIRRKLSEKGFQAKYYFSDIVYQSEKIRDCIETAKKYAQYDTPIHICGESGVGKELFCQSMHNSSLRKNAPFVAINCAAIPPALIESEFFGYEEGSFTGAKRDGKPGVFELAHGGTVFLDEISEIPMELQGRLLRVLQEKQVMRIGGDRIISVDVKIITASNKDLRHEMREGRFRKDLFFRINVLTLAIPPLSDRREDIRVLAKYFIKKYSHKYNKQELDIPTEVDKYLSNRKYEGNIRELEGLMERCVIVSSFGNLFEEKMYTGQSVLEEERYLSQSCALEIDLNTLENSYIRKVLEKTGGNAQKACQILKISRSTLWRKCKSQTD